MLDIVEKLYFMFFEGEIDRVDRMLERILRERESDFRVWLLLSLVKLRMKEYKLALEAINHAISLNSESIEAWLLRCKILSALNEFTDALVSINRAIQLSNQLDSWTDPELILEKARVLIKMQRTEEAKALIKQVLELSSNDEDALKLLKLTE